MKRPKKESEEEGDGVDAGLPAHVLGEMGRHDLGAGLAHQSRRRARSCSRVARSVSMSSGRAATVAERSPPPSCSRMMRAAQLRLGLHVLQLLEDAVGDSCGVLRGCSSQSLVSILLPTMV